MIPSMGSGQATSMGSRQADWRTWPGLTDYAVAVDAMEVRVAAIRAGSADEAIWLVEHPALYTAGTSAEPGDLLDPERLPVIATGRGGKHTWHGPGQRVIYAMLDLDGRGRDVRAHVSGLEAWIVAALGECGIAAGTLAGRTGVWVGEAKIAAIGVRVRRWVTFHGAAINIDPDLGEYRGIRPCGLEAPVTSCAALGNLTPMAQIDAALHRTADRLIGHAQLRAAAVQPLGACTVMNAA